MIDFKQFLVRQPSFPEEQPTDKYFWELSNVLFGKWEESHLMSGVHDGVKQRAILDLVGYFQDVSVDAGIWHAFIDEHNRMYGKALPFFKVAEDYVWYELNEVDVRFMLWYSIAMFDDNYRQLNPLDKELRILSELLYNHLESIYDTSPLPVGYKLSTELSVYDVEDEEEVYRLGNWLSMHCYLMMPAFALTLSDVIAALGDDVKDPGKLQEALGEAVMVNPTGPLALFIREWVHLILEKGTMPRQPKSETSEKEHPYYQKIISYGGSEIHFFSSYSALNEFLIKALGWADGDEHLVQLKESHDFVVLVNRHKGMLVARNVARNIAHPDNSLYDREYARMHAMKMLTQRGYAPCDLTMYVCRHGWLPDAFFDGSSCEDTVESNYDFIARCYLQQYYRD